MSGLRRDGRFELTLTRAGFWHRGRECACVSLGDVGREHLDPAGFRWQIGRGGNFLLVDGPGLAEGRTDALFQAVSGREPWRPSAVSGGAGAWSLRDF